MPTLAANIKAFLEQQQLPGSYRLQVEGYFLPFIQKLEPSIRRGELQVLGIHGAQGSGKSTLSEFFSWYLRGRGLTVAQVSLDDFYLRKAERQRLAVVQPLFKTRGVPGTHDITLAKSTLRQMSGLAASEEIRLPRFDKLMDDRSPESEWPRQRGPVDLIIFEGWCVAAPPQSESELASEVNELERDEDAQGLWRQAVNKALAEDYQVLWSALDYLLMLQAPGFSCVANWRLEQEQRLAAKRPAGGVALRAMDQAEVTRFVSHYQRLTEHCLRQLPAQADCVMTMNAERTIVDMRYRHHEVYRD